MDKYGFKFKGIIQNKNDVGYCVGITEIKKIIEDSVSEMNDMKWWENKDD